MNDRMGKTATNRESPVHESTTDEAPPTKKPSAWAGFRAFVSSLALVLLGFGLGKGQPIAEHALAPHPTAAPPARVSASPDYAYVMTLWLNLEQFASLSNDLDQNAIDLRSRAITYGYFRSRAGRIGSDIGRYGLEAHTIEPPAELRDIHKEYVGAADELVGATTTLTDALGPKEVNSTLLAKSDEQRVEAIQRLQTVGDQLLDRVWQRGASPPNAPLNGSGDAAP